MSRRAGEWHLLQLNGAWLTSDPVPTDSFSLALAARSYATMATAIRDCSSKLKRLSELHGWQGKAAERFAMAAEDVAGDLGAAHQRYEETGGALTDLVQPVEQARADSMRALEDAITASGAERAHAAGPPIANPTPDQVAADHDRANRLAEAQGARARANARLQAAIDALDDARRRAAKRIRDAAEHDSDGIWDNIKGGLRHFCSWAHLDVIVKILSAVAAVIALVLVVVAIIASAPAWLVIAGVAVSALLLAGDAALVISDSEGGSWTAVAWDVVGLLSFGVGRVMGGAARASAAAARDMAALRLGAEASTQEAARLSSSVEAARAANALKIADPGNALRIWAEGRTVVYAERAANAAVLAHDAVIAGELPRVASELSRLAGLSELTAAEAAKIQAAQQALRVVAGAEGVGHVNDAWNAIVVAQNVLEGKPGLAGESQDLNHLVDDLVARSEWRLTH